jgi:hypothetical protein
MPNRIEREIEEILTRLDEFVPNERRSRRVGRRAGAVLSGLQDRFMSWTRGVTGGHVVLAAAIVLIVALFLSGPFPTLSRLAVYAALTVFFAAIVFSIRPLRRRQATRFWRGQPVELRRPGPLTQLRMFWRRRNRRRF